MRNLSTAMTWRDAIAFFIEIGIAPLGMGNSDTWVQVPDTHTSTTIQDVQSCNTGYIVESWCKDVKISSTRHNFCTPSAKVARLPYSSDPARKMVL